MENPAATDGSRSESQVALSFSWEVFVLLLSILSIVNLVLELLPIAETSKSVLYVIDAGLTLVFLPDFFRRLYIAPSKRGYFFRGGGILDLLGSIPLPGFRLLRLFHVTRAIRMLRRYGISGMRMRFGETAAQGSILLVVFVAIVVLDVAVSATEGTRHNPIGDTSIEVLGPHLGARFAFMFGRLENLPLPGFDGWKVSTLGRARANHCLEKGLIGIAPGGQVNALSVVRGFKVRGVLDSLSLYTQSSGNCTSQKSVLMV